MPKKHIPAFDEHPVRVTLCFKTKKDRDEFMGGLSDGFGENFCGLDWEYDKGDSGPGFESAELFTVEVFEPED